MFDNTARGRVERRWKELETKTSDLLAGTRGIRKLAAINPLLDEDTVAVRSGPYRDNSTDQDRRVVLRRRRPTLREVVEMSAEVVTTAEDPELTAKLGALTKSFGRAEDRFLLDGDDSHPGLSDEPAAAHRYHVDPKSVQEALDGIDASPSDSFGLALAPCRIPSDPELVTDLERALRGGPIVASLALGIDEALLVRTAPSSVRLHVAREARLELVNASDARYVTIALTARIAWTWEPDPQIRRLGLTS